MLKLTWLQAAAWRLRRLYLHERAPAGSMLQVASRLCGLHAQVMSSAQLTLWARVEGLERGAVQKALWEERTLVKTWAMRGTLHLLRADELAMWHAALGTSRRYLNATAWEKYFGITIRELDAVTAAIATALEGRVLTRVELAREVGRLTGSAVFGSKVAESSWGTILRPAAFAGSLCFGPGVGQRVRFTRPDTWLARTLGSMEQRIATAEVTRRFLSAYGPASYHDLGRWWGGGVSTARAWIGALGEEVAAVDVEGARAWMLAQDMRENLRDSPKRSVRLLPGFDQYVVAASGYAEHLMPKGLRSRVYRPQGWISPVLLVNGRIEGVWRRQVQGSRLEVSIEPFGNAAAWVRRAAGLEAERLAAFLGCKLQLEQRSQLSR